MYGFKYRPIPLTVELKPLSENIGINGFLVSPEQVPYSTTSVTNITVCIHLSIDFTNV